MFFILKIIWICFYILHFGYFLILISIRKCKRSKYNPLNDSNSESLYHSIILTFFIDLIFTITEITSVEYKKISLCIISFIIRFFALIIQSAFYIKKIKIFTSHIIFMLFFWIIIILLIFVLNCILLFPKKENDYKLIVHGGGGKDGKKKLNSQEVFLYYANQGFDLIELDFLFTKNEEDIFCTHKFEYMDYNFDNRPTIEEVKNKIMILNKYKPIYLDWLLEQLIIYPDLTIIIDTKESDSQYFKMIKIFIKKCETFNIDYKRRFIPCVFSKQNYDDVHSLGFPKLWFSNSREKYSWKTLEKYFKDEKDMETYILSVIQFLSYKAIGFDPGKKFVDVYTVNGEDKIEFFYKLGVDFIVSDFPYIKNKKKK